MFINFNIIMININSIKDIINYFNINIVRKVILIIKYNYNFLS